MIRQRVVVKRDFTSPDEALKLAEAASRFRASLLLGSGGHWIDAKSRLGIMCLPIQKGSEVTLTAEGRDEVDAFHVMLQLLESEF